MCYKNISLKTLDVLSLNGVTFCYENFRCPTHILVNNNNLGVRINPINQDRELRVRVRSVPLAVVY
jgi:hypothetical protein